MRHGGLVLLSSIALVCACTADDGNANTSGTGGAPWLGNAGGAGAAGLPTGGVGPNSAGGIPVAAATGGSSGATAGLGGAGAAAGVGGAAGTAATATAGVGGAAGAAGVAGASGAAAGSGGTGASDAGSEAGTGGATDSGAGGGASMSSGCGKMPTLTASAAPVPAGSGVGGRVTIQSGGQDRSFIIRLPDDYDENQPYSLIFGFHWNGGLADDVDSGGSNGYISAHFGLQALSNEGAIFLAPQGIGNGWANTGGRDLQFVDDMLQLIQNDYCVDTTRIYTNGFSYGGGMSYALACVRANVFRAAAIYEGAQLSGCEGGTEPIALWQMVGLEDGITSMRLATPIRDRFVQNNGCTPQNPPQPPMAPPYLNPGGHVCTDYEGCMPGYPVRWCVHQSGHGNAIVDGTGDLYNSCATPPNTCSSTCPCSWVAEDVWSWMNSL